QELHVRTVEAQLLLLDVAQVLAAHAVRDLREVQRPLALVDEAREQPGALGQKLRRRERRLDVADGPQCGPRVCRDSLALLRSAQGRLRIERPARVQTR